MQFSSTGSGSGIAGPESSTDNGIVVWDGTGGNATKDSTVTISSGVITSSGLIVNGGTLKIGTALAYAIFDATNVTGFDKTYLLPNDNGTLARTSDVTLAASTSITSPLFTGGGNSIIISPTSGASKTVTLRTTTAGGVDTTVLTLNADQTATFAKGVTLTTGNLTVSGGGLDVTASNGGVTMRGTTPRLSWNAYFGLQALTDGVMRLFNDASSKGVSFDITTADGTLKLRNKTNGADGNFTAGTGVFSGPVTLPGYTVATLPAGTVGMIAYVTDALAPTFLGALTGGGSTVAPVFYNGSAWISH